MNENIEYAIHDQLERIADDLENIATLMEKLADGLTEFITSQNKTVELQTSTLTAFTPHLSLFFESIPTWLYNNLRRKNISTHLAAKLLNMPQSQLSRLSELGMIKCKGGRYDLVELLGYLEDTFSDNIQHSSIASVPVHKQ